MPVSEITTNKEGVRPDVAARLSGLYADIGSRRAKAEERFNNFAAQSQVAEEMQRPADSLRAALARIKDTVKHQNEPDAPSHAAVAKAKQTSLS